MGLLIIVISFLFAIFNTVFNWCVIRANPMNNEYQAKFNAISICLECYSSVWFSNFANSESMMSWNFVLAFVGLFMAINTMQIDLAVNGAYYETKMIFGSYALVEFTYIASWLWFLNDPPLFILLVPRVLGLISTIIPFFGILVIKEWRVGRSDCWSAFLGAATALFWLNDSNGTIDEIMIYAVFLIRVMYGIYLLVHSFGGAQAIWNELTASTNTSQWIFTSLEIMLLLVGLKLFKWLIAFLVAILSLYFVSKF